MGITTYQKYRSQGLCGRCGKDKTVVGKSHCKLCLIFEKERTQKRRQKLHSEGLCCSCGQRPFVKNNAKCQTCLDKQYKNNIRHIQKLKNNNLCLVCGQKARNSGSYCQLCLDKTNQQRKLNVDNNICGLCGKNSLVKNKSTCQKCLDYLNNRRRQFKRNGLCIHCGKATQNNKSYCCKCSINLNLRNRIWSALHRTKNKKLNKTINLIGCTILQLKQHLENQFQDGMTWEKRGKWHIHHIKPLATFDLSKEEEQHKAFHYTNLQPLWAEEHLRLPRPRD